MKLKAQVNESKIRAIIERVTELTIDLENGNKKTVYVFQTIGSDGRSHGGRIQNWECDNITEEFSYQEQEEIFQYCDIDWAKKN